MTTARKIICNSVVLGDVQCDVMHLPLVWAKYYPSLLNKEVVMSSIYEESWTICVKKNKYEKIVFYGEGMKRFIKRFEITYAFKIDYSPVWSDNRTEHVGVKNKTSLTLCTIFWDEHVLKGELSRISGGDDTIYLYGGDFKKFTKQYKIKYDSRIILDYLNVINVFIVKILDIDGVEIDYDNNSSIQHSTCLTALQVSDGRNANNDKFVKVSEMNVGMGSSLQSEDRSTKEVDYTNNSSIEHNICLTALEVPDGRNANDDKFVAVSEWNVSEVGMGSGLQFKDRSTKEVYDQFVVDGSIGDGVSAFVKEFTDSLCSGHQKIVREYLHAIGSPTYANMCFGEEKVIKCIIKWGDKYYGDQTYITRPMKEIIKEIKHVPGSNVLFNIIDWDLMRKTVTFEVVNIGK
ncbi:hypothetical protein ACFE04_011688 [Oxalis oulophora]